MRDIFSLDNTYQILLMLLIFLLPLSVAGTNIVSVLILVLWLGSGDYKSKLRQIGESKVLLASIMFFSLHVIGLLWTEDVQWGMKIIKKMLDFVLLFPILYTLTKKAYIKYYISAFLLAMTISELSSYLIWFELIPPFGHATADDPTAFIFHILYNPLLAFAIYLVGHEIVYNSSLSKIRCFLGVLLVLTMTINMFITGGRAGQVAYFALLILFIFQYFRTQKIKALCAVVILVPGVLFTAYQTSNIFQARVGLAATNLVSYADNKNSSVGQRLTYIINSWGIILEHPVIGVGTGDFPIEYTKINARSEAKVTNLHNPHNMYILILVQLGLVGLVSLFSIFYYQVRFALRASDRLTQDIGLALPLLFLVIMWSESYLLLHETTVLFVFFSSFVYKKFE